MSARLFFGLLLSLLVLWFCAAVCTTIWTNDMYPYRFCCERWFGALLHLFFILALSLTLWSGRARLRKFRIALLVILLLFCGLLYAMDVWPSILAAFVRAPWAIANERGPAISNASGYAFYTWEWDVGPNGVDK